MGLRINTNVPSLTAQNRLEHSRRALDHTQNKLSSGSRIIRAMDDAAGLAISESIRSTMRCSSQNIKNAQNAFHVLQTADGALNEITNTLIRMKELAVQAASDTNGEREKGYLNAEYQELKAEIQRISDTTLFNGRPLLGGEGGTIEVQVGPNNTPEKDRIIVPADFDITIDSLQISDFDIGTAEGARDTLEPMELALERISSTRGAIGAAESRLQVSVNNLEIYHENLSGAFSEIRDADLAEETSNFTKYNILTQAGVAILAQANSTPSLALKLLQG